MRKGLAVVISLLPLCMAAQTGRNMTRQEYIDTYKDLAMREMERSGIPASITLAQGLLESGNGNSTLARKGNNHFGIKCHDWKGKTIYHDDDAKNECFRKYKSVEESYHDHSEFLKGRSRYAELFSLKPDDYKAWARGLKKTGYATSATYAEALIKIIEENRLYQYDDLVLGLRGAKTREKPSYAAAHYAGGRKIYFNNRVKYVLAREGDSFYNLSEELDLFQWQLPKYNDAPDSKVFAEGETVYLQPKRNQADIKHKTHTIKAGETLNGISQHYAIRLDKLAKRNGLVTDAPLTAGQQLLLRGRIKGQKPQLKAPRIEIKEDAPKDDFIIEFDADK